jgi:murein DD-endopeptidase MepM/ murein hydrolase activator NlpD
MRIPWAFVFARKALVGGLVAAALFPTSAAARIPDYVRLPPKEPPARFGMPLKGLNYWDYGMRWGRMHRGTDIAVLGGHDVIRAPLAGKVTHVGWLNNYSGYGFVVKIRHDHGLVTMYAHLDSSSVRPGEWVGKGQVLGHAGCTGSCTGEHLHFEVTFHGELRNPRDFIGKRFPPLN